MQFTEYKMNVNIQLYLDVNITKSLYHLLLVASIFFGQPKFPNSSLYPYK